jgi:hypothetical protein
VDDCEPELDKAEAAVLVTPDPKIATPEDPDEVVLFLPAILGFFKSRDPENRPL